MSVWDNVKKFAQPYSDEEYDDYDEDDYMDDYEEPAQQTTRRRRPAAAPVEEEEDDAFSGFSPVAAAAPAAAPAASTGFTGHVVSSASHAGRSSTWGCGAFMANKSRRMLAVTYVEKATSMPWQ